MNKGQKETGRLSGYLLLLLICSLVVSFCSASAETKTDGWTVTRAWEKYKNGPPADPNFFPILVWLQSPSNAVKYKAAGFNTYFGLHKGPSAGQIETLKAAGMYLVCEMNEEALKHRDDKTIIGWMTFDEPENFATKAPLEVNGKTWNYGPATSRISAKDIGEMYEVIKKEDSTRPVWLNFSCGVANDKYHGRGSGWKNSMYPDYMKAADVVGFDVYPTSSVGENTHWLHARGLDRMKEWAGPEKPRFNFFGPTFTGKGRKPTTEEFRTEVWISIIHGTKGLAYFAHNFKPKFQEAALLADAEMLAAVTKINTQVTELAPVINGPDSDGVAVTVEKEAVPVDILIKKYKEETYIFSAAMKQAETAAVSFQVKGVTAAGKVQVLGEDRTLDIDATGKFKDEFKTWGSHVYKVVKN